MLSGRPFTGAAVELMVWMGGERELWTAADQWVDEESLRDAGQGNESGALERGRSCDVRVGG